MSLREFCNLAWCLRTRANFIAAALRTVHGRHHGRTAVECAFQLFAGSTSYLLIITHDTHYRIAAAASGSPSCASDSR